MHTVAGGRFFLLFGVRESPPARGALFSSTSLKTVSEVEFEASVRQRRGKVRGYLPQTASQEPQTDLTARAASVSTSPAGLGHAGVGAGARGSVFEHKFENRVRG